jgi:hypothetical protein
MMQPRTIVFLNILDFGARELTLKPSDMET